MRVRIVTLFVLVLLCSIFAAAQTVAESESSLAIVDDKAHISLAIDSTARATNVFVELMLLDVAGGTRAHVSEKLAIEAGRRRYKFVLPMETILQRDSSEIGWWRLSYTVGPTRGIISLSQLLRDDFQLRAAAFQRPAPGEPYRIRVHTLNPISEQPVKDVFVKVELTLPIETTSDQNELKLEGTARTNRDGFAIVDLKIPAHDAGVKFDGDPSIKITGSRNGVVRIIDEELDSDDEKATAILTTDKPLYQPGQTFNVRALLLDRNSTVMPNVELEFSIEDEDDTVVFRQNVATSGFGIASISWPIPDNSKLGNYRVVLEADTDVRADQLQFKISRYDLPNFTVTAKPDKKYYLPAEKEALIEVTADYLFGKPVTNGKVRVVKESNRKWNYAQQEYEIEEGTAVEGMTDAAGKFTARVDLSQDLIDLEQSQWRRFEDLSFAAYYTDLSTNRTEQRRFDIRLTKEPIHIYFIHYAYQHADLPLTAYVSTFYADGTPAKCNVEVKDTRGTTARFRTNSLGAGKFEARAPRPDLHQSRYAFNVTARDKKGLTGTFDDSFYFDEDDALQIRSDKTIYRPGEMIEVELESNVRSGFVYLDVVKNWITLDSRVVRLDHGKATLTIPYKPSFRGDLFIAAYSDKKEGRWNNEMRGIRGIIFPEQQNLVLKAKFSKDEYLPGEAAAVSFSVLDGAHRPVESAIGLGIFDKAIEDRARTDSEFGGYFSRFSSLLGYDRSFGSITLKDLNDLDLSQPASPEMQLAAEVLLAGAWYYPTVYHSGDDDAGARSLYKEQIDEQFKPVGALADARYKKDGEHPVDAASFASILLAGGLDAAKLIDPWGQPYVVEFSVDRTTDVIKVTTAGPDKVRATDDDFNVWSSSFAYFTRTGEAIDKAVIDHHQRTNEYIRDLNTLIREMTHAGINPALLKDRWGRDYHIDFDVSGRHYLIRISSRGLNGIYEPSNSGSDDFEVWKTYTDYFAKTETEVNRILSDQVNIEKKRFPRSEAEFIEMLGRGGLDLESVTDGYGRPVYVVGSLETRYTNRTKIENGKTTITPITEEMLSFALRSRGADLSTEADDVNLAIFSGAITAAYAGTGFAKSEVKTVPFSGAKGAITGTITDANGAVIPNTEVVATDDSDESRKFTTRTDDVGKYLLENLPSGRYTVFATAAGFGRFAQHGVQVWSQTLVEVNIQLQVAATGAMVTVVADAGVDQSTNTTSARISTTTVTKFKVGFPYNEQTSTPRLREYFPESLLWQPELLTDKKGRAEAAFKMADNITTWKMFAIASTKKGKIGVVEKEVTAFQPFFVDLDPPKFLTQGDEIWLPTQVRNYTEKNQRVDVKMNDADWFTFLDDKSSPSIDVSAGASRNAVFGFKAAGPVKDGKQRVTAIARGASDAVEKPVTVRPDGEEIVRTDSKVFKTSFQFDLSFPVNALPGTQRAQLKLYPNLFSHVTESVEGMLERPYGCGEQTISSTYPNLMILKFVKNDTALRQKAQRYLQKGYERLTGYQVADGGFTYWGGKDASDVALTAYALRFLNDAKEFVQVDPEVMRRADAWLISQQRADGSWAKLHRWETSEDTSRTKLITTYIARSLAMRTDANKAAIVKALTYLKTRNTEIDEPYALALFGLASLDAGDTDIAKQVAAQLEKMAIPEGSTVYWKLETNTPFYGWGTAGRVETTALVVQLLTRVGKIEQKPASDLISKGLLFLLKNKDRYGVWYSTQSTVNVLDAFLEVLATEQRQAEQTITVTVNGTPLPGVAIPADQLAPIDMDLNGKLSASANVIEVRSSSPSPVMAQLVATHYINWSDSVSTNVNVGTSRALKLDYKCSNLNIAVMDEVTCSVNAERIGFRGYGMLLAEIGTPPGADVSRESLETAIEGDWSVSHYDILPDRVIVYMWSKAGGTHFNFRFRPRYAINAQTAPSTVYDYYNPDARATVAPLRFIAH